MTVSCAVPCRKRLPIAVCDSDSTHPSDMQPISFLAYRPVCPAEAPKRGTCPSSGCLAPGNGFAIGRTPEMVRDLGGFALPCRGRGTRLRSQGRADHANTRRRQPEWLSRHGVRIVFSSICIFAYPQMRILLACPNQENPLLSRPAYPKIRSFEYAKPRISNL
jgi:hypothetical protein